MRDRQYGEERAQVREDIRREEERHARGSHADARRLRRIGYANIAVLEKLMQGDDDYVKEVVVFGLNLGMNETELRAKHEAFIADVYAFINELREARSRTTPPRRPQLKPLIEFVEPSDEAQ